MATLKEKESIQQFEQRKVDHIHLSLNSSYQASEFSDLDRLELNHEALPELNFDEISTETNALSLRLSTPFLVSSMTAGHVGGVDLNQRIAKVCAKRGWLMGVGSQRRELFDSEAAKEWLILKEKSPDVKLLGNIGISQLIQTSTQKMEELVRSLGAVGMIVHLNPLQECLQPEGTPQFRGGFERIKELSESLSVPVIVKETGCGFSKSTLMRLNESKVAAVDVSGRGGTHWGRIEGGRARENLKLHEASQTFSSWGISTAKSVLNALDIRPNYEIWASGGVRSGLDSCKLLSLGSRVVGFAQPVLKAALKSEDALDEWMEKTEFELKVAMFCTGSKDLNELTEKKVWQWRT